MLAGEAVVAIWNGIAPEARAQFYDWHINEHMPERVGIPGFRRGRRYIALDPDTQPEFFTLYEADTIEVLKGSDYANRLNDPTPATKATTSQFRNTARALARVLDSRGPGAGGAVLTVRFDADESLLGPLRVAVHEALHAPRITGAHLCRADQDASGVRTTETRDRADIEAPPTWFMLLEATDAGALTGIHIQTRLTAAGVCGPLQQGLYRLEYTRNKTEFAA
ncbi:MAG TPA: hypothetical protein VLI93_05415 [Acetobacteraceae bacterium]|nr:hypothetical protein [Acetobacteraceae bacterium]